MTKFITECALFGCVVVTSALARSIRATTSPISSTCIVPLSPITLIVGLGWVEAVFRIFDSGVVAPCSCPSCWRTNP